MFTVSQYYCLNNSLYGLGGVFVLYTEYLIAAIKHFFKKELCHASVFLPGSWEDWQPLQWSDPLSSGFCIREDHAALVCPCKGGWIPLMLAVSGEDWVLESR